MTPKNEWEEATVCGSVCRVYGLEELQRWDNAWYPGRLFQKWLLPPSLSKGWLRNLGPSSQQPPRHHRHLRGVTEPVKTQREPLGGGEEDKKGKLVRISASTLETVISS